MRRVVIESPYAGRVRRNLHYARLCLRDSLARGEAPLASHLLYTQVLDDEFEPERKLGMQAGWSWLSQADAVVLYQDFGTSRGMLQAMCEAQRFRIPVEKRRLVADSDMPWLFDSDKEKALGIHWTSPIRNWLGAIWGEPAALYYSQLPAGGSARQAAEISSENFIGRPAFNDPDEINGTLAGENPRAFPFGEQKKGD